MKNAHLNFLFISKLKGFVLSGDKSVLGILIISQRCSCSYAFVFIQYAEYLVPLIDNRTCKDSFCREDVFSLYINFSFV